MLEMDNKLMVKLAGSSSIVWGEFVRGGDPLCLWHSTLCSCLRWYDYEKQEND
jgi:hypothetical protein